MNRITFSREPSIWIGLLGAVSVAVINSGAVPELSANAASYSTLVALVVGILIRFFVSPAKKAAPAPAAPAAPSTPPAA